MLTKSENILIEPIELRKQKFDFYSQKSVNNKKGGLTFSENYGILVLEKYH
jgi:hypothetical protein